jgi:hypothetical protein
MQNYHSSDVGFEVSSNSHSKPLIMICNHSSSNWSEPPIHKAWWVVLKNSHNELKRHNCKNDSERQNDERNIMSPPCFHEPWQILTLDSEWSLETKDLEENLLPRGFWDQLGFRCWSAKGSQKQHLLRYQLPSFQDPNLCKLHWLQDPSLQMPKTWNLGFI